jgi:hypothetical protein
MRDRTNLSCISYKDGWLVHQHCEKLIQLRLFVNKRFATPSENVLHPRQRFTADTASKRFRCLSVSAGDPASGMKSRYGSYRLLGNVAHGIADI